MNSSPILLKPRNRYLYTTYTTITACSIFFPAYNHFVSNNSCLSNLFSGDLQTTTVLFTRNASSHKTDLPFYCTTQQSEERSWSIMFVFSHSRELYYVFIFVCVLYTHSLLSHFRYLSLSYSYCRCSRLTYN